MKTAAAWRTGVATDPGLQRAVNEDRVLADNARGVFLVVDGLGGHAAGEMAAETALRVIEKHMASPDDVDLEAQIRRAITEANNQIFDLAESNPDWHGMACVLTLAVAHEDRVTLGHVGDSRLYLAWNGNLRKMTSDHSPVGELEDQGELTEMEAMQHPRRNEVFRDAGSRPHQPHDPQFIETKSFLFRPDAALLLCSDGLSDVLTSAQINAIIERYDGDPSPTAARFIEAANDAGGKDNISVVFVAGPEFLGSQSSTLQDVRPRHAITRTRAEPRRWHGALKRVLWLLAGMLLGMLLMGMLERLIPRPSPQPAKELPARTPAHITVNAADPRGIIQALSAAIQGDTVEIPPGEYLGPLILKDQVNVVSTVPGQAILRIDPAAPEGVAVIARGVREARFEGVRIAGDATHPLRTGMWIADSDVELDNVDVSGASEAAVRIDGTSKPLLLANFVHGNSGAGVLIRDHSAPRLIGNWITENGRIVGALRGGVEIETDGQPQLQNNLIVRNGLVEHQ